ncbi:MAG: hypothetical protein AAF907_05635 [Planctomycetota bacterium]
MKNFKTRLDRSIYQSIRRYTAERPQTPVGILWAVDARERLVLSHEELSGGLSRLIADGLVAEVAPHRYCDTSTLTDAEREASQPFSGWSKTDHERAVQDYRNEFRHQLKKLEKEADDDGFTQQVMSLRCATPGGRWPTEEDECAAEELAEAVEPLLAETGLAEVNGFEQYRGGIDVLIFARENVDLQSLYKVVAPAFRKFGCLPGSSILLIDPATQSEIETDLVPPAG